ncbi:uncharacterized protein A4U43_C09F14920 [Asparagus officinalis]|uniref:Sulfotransferase n=1 Tax=Asparagus officinalis TaxID=4686 RepID=A0A5P1E831_ASPOF|nr:uncharacterized protein A4U43_C09F14920 [Asparagus officinalis]
MASSPPLSKCFASPKTREEEESDRALCQHYREKVLSLPSVDGCAILKLHEYNGWFAPMPMLLGAMAAQKLFRAKPSDVILATAPKSGTTWLKSILFAVVHRDSPHYEPEKYLTTVAVHECVPFLENHVYANGQDNFNLNS